jgi:hypothetical protein
MRRLNVALARSAPRVLYSSVRSILSFAPRLLQPQQALVLGEQAIALPYPRARPLEGA